MHLLFQQVADALKTKWAGALQQHDFITHRLKDTTLHKIIHIGKEPLLTNLYLCSLTGNLRSDTYEPVDTTLGYQFRHLTIQLSRRLTRLIDITQNQRLTFPFLFRTTVHEVQCNIQGVHVTVIRVINQRQSALSLLHFQSHGDRLQLWHTFGQFLGCQPQRQRHRSTSDGVLDTGLIDKRDIIAALYTFIYI